jgi:hypothetical protein
LVQRLDGGLTLGDTHAYDDTAGFDFDLAEEPYEHLHAVAEALLGRPRDGGVTTTTVTDPIGRTSQLIQYSAAPTLNTPAGGTPCHRPIRRW